VVCQTGSTTNPSYLKARLQRLWHPPYPEARLQRLWHPPLPPRAAPSRPSTRDGAQSSNEARVGQNAARRGVAFPEAMCNAFHGGSKAVVKARGTTCHG
jgi:hypothetical protein